MKAIFTKIISVVVSIFMLTTYSAQAETISSTQNGNWNAGTTWLGGIIPTSADSVVVNHLVDIYTGDSCLHLYVSPTGTIQNKINASRTLVVKGNLYVDGTATYTNNYFYIRLRGNLHLNGIWSNPRVIFIGSANQVVSASPGKVFTATRTGIIFEDADPASPVTFASNLVFKNIAFDFANATLEFLPAIQVEVYEKSVDAAHVVGNNASFLLRNGAYINNCTLDNLTFKGLFNVGSGNSTTGDIVVADTLQNLINASRTLDVNGNFTNNGVIQITNNYFHFTFSGNVANNGKWTCGNISFDGASQQYLSCASGKYFYCNNFTDSDAGSPIHLLGDTEIRKAVVDLGGTTLDAENYRIVLRENAYIKNSVLNDAHLGGEFRVYTPQVTFTGTTVVDDTLQNAPYTTNPLVLFEDMLINNGTINRSNNFGLHMLIAGNLENNASINSEYVVFTGTSDQILSSTTKGNIIETDNFDDMDAGSKIIVTGTLTLINATADLNGAIMKLENANLVLSGGQFEDGIIEAQGNEISQSNAGSFESIYIKNALLKGKCLVYGGANIFEDTYVMDTLQNYPITINPVLTVIGNFVNNGMICKSTTYRIHLKVEDNFDNEGPCELYQLNFSGSGDQYFKSPVYPIYNANVTSSKTSGMLVIDDEVLLLNCAVDFDDNTLQIAENQTLFLDNSYLSYIVVTGGENSVLNLSNSSYFSYSTVNDCHLAGIVEMSANVNLNDCIIDGLVQNRAITYNPHVTIGGINLNKGIFTNRPSFTYQIYCDIKGHVYNDGIWRVKENDWNGTVDQDIYLLNNKNIGTESIFTSNVSGGTYQWNKNGIPISGGTHLTYTLDSILPANRGYYQCITDNGPSRIIRVCTPVEIDLATEAWFCQNETVMLEPEIAFGEPPYQWSWSPAEGLSDANIQNPLANPEVPTIYSLTVTDAIGCKGETNIFVQQYPQLYASAGSDKEICTGSSTVLNGSASGGTPDYNFSWTPEAGLNNPNIPNPIASPETTTLYTLTVIDENGCQETADVTVTVHPLPLPFPLTLGGHFCEGIPSAIVEVNGSEVGVNYHLLRNGAETGEVMAGTGEPLEFYTIPLSGTYTVRGINATTGCMKMMSGSIPVAVDYVPVVVSQSEDDVVVVGTTIGLFVNVTGTDPIVFKWYHDEMLVYSGPSNVLTLENLTLDHTGMYYCVVENTCGFNQSAPIQLTVLDHQIIDIPAGWSGFSTSFDVWDGSVENMFSEVQEQLIIVNDFSQIYWPAGAINNYGSWNPHFGAQVKFSEAASIEIKGYQVEDASIELEAGWHYLPVLSRCVVSASDVFNQFGTSLDLAKDIAGARVYWPAYNVFTLNVLEPGKAYLIKLNSSCSLTFPECLKESVNTSNPSRPVNASPWPEPCYTASSHLIVIPQNVAENVLQNNDWIAVFTRDGVCSGVADYETSNLIIPAFADDPTTAETDGLTENDLMILKVFRAADHQYFDLSPEYSDEADGGYFTSNGISVIENLKATNITTPDIPGTDVIIHPNPACEIMYVKGLQSSVYYELVNTSGTIVQSGLTGPEGQVLTGSLPSGLYTIRLVTDNGVICRKVVLR